MMFEYSETKTTYINKYYKILDQIIYCEGRIWIIIF